MGTSDSSLNRLSLDYGITTEEARNIAEKSSSEAEFSAIWELEDWWEIETTT